MNKGHKKSALTIANALDCYRKKGEQAAYTCKNVKCPYNNAKPGAEYCCVNALLHESVAMIRRQNATVVRFRKMARWRGDA